VGLAVLGASDGTTLGARDGTTLGACDGTTLGACDGTTLGAYDGTTLGACDGSLTLWMSADFCGALMDTMDSADTSLRNGKSLCSASVAASALLPLPAGPSSRHVMSGDFSLTRTCSCE
jgi:hypothetical protein